MNQNPHFQVGLDVMDRPCLVVGGGREAEDKAQRLLDAGADLRLVSPSLTPALRQKAEAGLFTYHPRRFEPDDLTGAFLVANTVSGNPELTRRVYDLACRQGCLINSYDSPAFSNFGMVALVHPGHLRLSISTSNASPTLARCLRRDLEALFDREFVDYLDQLAQVRRRVREQVPEFPRRAALLRSLVDGFHLEGDLAYPPDWRRRIAALMSCDLERCGTPEQCPDCPLPLSRSAAR